MASADLSPDALRQQILALDDKIEALVHSLDAEEPSAHAAVYAEIETLHKAIFALRAQLRQLEGKG